MCLLSYPILSALLPHPPHPCIHSFLGGHALRTYALKGLILQEIAPPLDEISRFNAAAGQDEAEDAVVRAAAFSLRLALA